MTNEKQEKPVDEMTDRELAEHVLGKELVEKLHEEFDLRDVGEAEQDEDDGHFTPSR